MANVLKEKTFDFAVKIVQLSKDLQSKNEFILSKQVLRSGTAIGALVRESQNAESTKDFIHKLSIAQKECDETLYWLELLNETDLINKEVFEKLHSNCEEILKILKSIILTSKRKLNS
ncbi:four helix bundle protein [Faecalibacter macacae]|uniref:Four helix bundle protein n=1 Tax=Faecalibacter macacae TaxID=1859289 RepID=A0A3L9MHH7_9FLAO|nr:four helix bundle protein [Faecalibacter macacae]RLZ12241.1 four helix bundle protein [Faecalibacter macacae]